MKVPHVCPRCQLTWIPNNDQPGAYPGAISRADNKTEICSDCGTAEALQDFAEGGCSRVESWPVGN
jgi:hypothetical protein